MFVKRNSVDRFFKILNVIEMAMGVKKRKFTDLLIEKKEFELIDSPNK